MFIDSCFRCERPLMRSEIVEIDGATFCRRCAGYYRGFHTPNRWSANRVDWLLPSTVNVEQLADELQRTISEACDERPLQEFFERNPSLLVQFFPYGGGRWVWSHPHLGSEHIPDFMVCGADSAGPHWHLIELESPRISVLRKDGQQRNEFTHARKQIDDWRIWLRNNIAYAQSELGYVGLDAEFRGMIIMGRRADIDSDEHQKQYRELSRGPIKVMSYDRLSETIIEYARLHQAFLDDVLHSTKGND